MTRSVGSEAVLVAMSGGVDSSVAAALLAEAGFPVLGVTMRLPGDSTGAADGARRVAARLGVPHYVLDVREEFERLVVEPFVETYLAGATPNPCVTCNRVIKLGSLLGRARALGCRYVATGHYARVLGAARGARMDDGSGRHLLWRAADKRKDQSYVLYALSQEQLGHLLLPLGNLTKARVRSVARSRGLPTAERAESQEICFIPGHDYREFLRRRRGAETFRPGPILTTSGEEVGRHSGLAYFTVGQRRRLGLERQGPWYVLALDPRRNAVIVGGAEELGGTVLKGEEALFIPFDWPTGPLRVEAKIRYSGPPAPATLAPLTGRRVRLEFDRPQRAITPGQAVVFYRGEEVVGGATIVPAWPAEAPVS